MPSHKRKAACYGLTLEGPYECTLALAIFRNPDYRYPRGQFDRRRRSRDFESRGIIRNPGDLDALVEGALDNLTASLAAEVSAIKNGMRFKVFYTGICDDWRLIDSLSGAVSDDPLPTSHTTPVPL